ncbi:hypothetical protein [Nocardia wallacei]|uniref:hypothetical protein n=1 Tax=Nocardia wallacei TaxID=480035 RepID=UPI002457145B|nr:hypothetical protein [Nocardia wallacei]
MYTLLAIHQLAMMAQCRNREPIAPSLPGRMRHIHIEAGTLTLDYQATAEQVWSVAALLAQSSPELVVTVDDDVRVDLPTLPCSGLWE